MTGEGIGFAVHSGRLAARSLLAGNLEPAQVGPQYGRALNSEILPELRAARLLAHLLYRQRGLRKAVFQRYGRRLCEKVTQVLMAESSYRRILGNPRNHLGLLRR